MKQINDTEFQVSEEFVSDRREARNFVMLWIIQTVVMISTFLLLGYNRIDDPLGFPFGFPSWFVIGVLAAALMFGLVSIVMALRMKQVDLK